MFGFCFATGDSRPDIRGGYLYLVMDLAVVVHFKGAQK